MLVGSYMIDMEFGGELFDVPVSFIVIGIGAIVFEISLTNYSLGIDDIFAVIFIVLCLAVGINFEYIYDLWYMMSLLFILPICLIVNFRKHKMEKAQELQRIEENLKKCMEDKLDGFWVKYGQAVCKNDYSEWHKERDCFLDDFVSKNHTSYHHLNTINFDITAKFDEYWNELVEKSDNVVKG
jgi:hypothetical protein